MTPFSFSIPSKTLIGVNALEHLPFELAAMGAKKTMVIPDLSSGDSVAALTRAFKDGGVVLGISKPAPPETEGRTDHREMFIRGLHTLYLEEEYDALIALGSRPAADTAKALNLAVTHGLAALESPTDIKALGPLLFLPVNSDAMEGAAASAQYGTRRFNSLNLAPDLVVVDPRLSRPEDRNTLIDRALTFLGIGCEVFAVTPAPPARAYASVVVTLAWEALTLLTASGLKGPDDLRAGRKEERAGQKKLIQAAVLSGYLLSCHRPILALILGDAMSEKSRIGRGQIMSILLPSILESHGNGHTGELLRLMTDPVAFSSVPVSRQSLFAIQKIRDLSHTLFSLSHGMLPRTLAEAGWGLPALETLADKICQDQILSKKRARTLTRILTCAWDGRPMEAPAAR